MTPWWPCCWPRPRKRPTARSSIWAANAPSALKTWPSSSSTSMVEANTRSVLSRLIARASISETITRIGDTSAPFWAGSPAFPFAKGSRGPWRSITIILISTCSRERPDMSPSIPQTNPKSNFLSHKDEIDAAVSRVLQSGWYILGREVAAFEEEFAAYLGIGHAIGVANGTDALHVALRACGVGPGDRVFTVSHTAVATVAAIE